MICPKGFPASHIASARERERRRHFISVTLGIARRGRPFSAHAIVRLQRDAKYLFMMLALAWADRCRLLVDDGRAGPLGWNRYLVNS